MTALVEIPPHDPGTPPHRHSGPVYGYLLEGELLFELEGDPPPQVDVVEQPGVDRWRLIRPDGYVGWVGTPEEFPSWAERYFRWRASPKPLGARR